MEYIREQKTLLGKGGKEWVFGEGCNVTLGIKTPKHTFCKKNNNPHLNYLPYLYEKKSFRLSTYADGIYKYTRENPLVQI